MRRLLLVVLLAGCTQVAPADDPAPLSDPAILTECVLAKPDGSSACEGSEFAAALSASRPSPLDGWKCTNAWTGQGQYAELYVTIDGRVGMYWEWQRGKADGLAFQRLAWYEGHAVGEVLHVPYQERGFVAFPARDVSGTVEIHTGFRLLRAHAFLDGEWAHPTNATFIVDSYGGDTWWGTRFDWPGGPYFLSTMHEEREEGRFTAWEGSGWRGKVGGVDVIIDHVSGGVKHIIADFGQRRVMASACGVTT